MKKLIILAFLFASSVASLQAAGWVNGYYRSSGTWVPGHYRTSPDSSFSNNYSSWGNTNPYTGRRGYKRCTSYWGCN